MPADPSLPYGRQWIDEDDIAAVTAVLKSDFLSTGPEVARFESRLAEAARAQFAYAVSSGTSALHLAYAACGVRSGHEVITSPLTFVATANAACYLGARPVFVDCDPRSGLIDPDAAEAAIGPNTRAIVAVDYAGHPADYDALADVAQRREVSLIADAAHSIGATYRGRPVGSLALATTFSFHPVKLITTGEGGAVATDDPLVARSISELRSHGIVRDKARLHRDDGSWYYEMQALGSNYRLTDFQAALGSSQLQKLPRFLKRRRAIAATYDAAFAEIDGIDTPFHATDVEHAWHLYVLRVKDAGRRRAFFDELTRLGLRVQVHFIPVHTQPFYEELGFLRGSCPAAEDFASRCVTIPLFPAMSDADVQRVVESVAIAVRSVL